MSLVPSLRPAGLADAAELARLHALCFDDAWSASSFEQLLAGPHVCGFVSLLADGELAGFVLIQIIAGEAEILTIGVAARLRGQGLGARLLAEACAQARARGAVSVFLEVAEDNVAARALYGRAGFAPMGRRKSYYRVAAAGGGTGDALVLRLSLNE